MKRHQQPKKKKIDTMFISITIIAIVIMAIFSSVFKKIDQDDNIVISDLPENAQKIIGKLVINEIVSKNRGIYVNSNNEVTDYIELYNGTDKAIDLSGYGLSDRKDRVKWVFDAVVIEPDSYLVIALTGKEEAGLNASFKLRAAGGEYLILVNKSGKIIDAVETVALGTNQSMNRNADGSWYISNYGTPNQENSLQGLNAYLATLEGEPGNEIVINEILVKNNGNFLNEQGRLDGFVELINISDQPVSLKDYYLGSDKYSPFRYQFADVVLMPNELYVLYTGNNDLLADNYLGFTFNNRNGSVVLSKNGRIVQSLEYENLANGYALTRIENFYVHSPTVSLGQPNDGSGIEEFQNQYLQAPKDLIINEAMNRNDKYLAQNGYQFYDWIELYNNSDQSILLSDYCLSTSSNNLQAYRLPEVTLQPYQYYIIMCSGETSLTNSSYYHSNFKLSDSESIFLSRNNKLIDCMFIAEVPYGYSYGRCGTVGYYYLANPTPGEDNGSGIRSISVSPVVLTQAGVYNDVSNLTVAVNGSGNIYYTTDGSEPDTYCSQYKEPINLSKTTVLKFKSFGSGQMPSKTVTSSYVINENHSLPVMIISMDAADFAYLNAHSFAIDLQLQCYVEFYEKDSGFSIPCSISCFGGNSRNQPKKSYALRFDSPFGSTELNYDLFENRESVVFDSLVLRTGSNDWTRTMIRDILSTTIMDEYLDVQAYKPCVLYINGYYWGIYNIREKINAKFIAGHYNVNPETVSIVNVDFSQKAGTDNIHYLFSWVKNNDLAVKENYDFICSKIDIVNFADFWIAQMYCVNPDVHNVRYFRSPEIDDGKWKYIYYDMDHGFRLPNINYYTTYLCNPYGMTGWVNNTYDNALPRELFRNSEFRELWFERLAYHLNNALSKEKLTAIFEHLKELYHNDIARDRERWKYSMDPIINTYPSMSLYNSHLKIIENFIEVRQKIVLTQTKNYFSLTDQQMKELFGDLW
ncbi:MAG TPA: lamin tail domain-containing protein [Erysipelotrichaceae bacterium]|nr:lamin tail domain-containing protein [Erysipelotrichaceae bacterium]